MTMATDPRDIIKKFQSIKAAEPAEYQVRLKSTKFSEKVIVAYDWYEENWLPVKGLRLLAGPTGVGKSTMFFHEIAKLTTGEYEGHEPIDCIYLTSEGNDSMTTARVKVSGADMTRVSELKLEHVKDEEVVYEVNLNLKQNLELIEEYLHDNPEIKAIFLDPMNSLIGVSEDKDGYDIRMVLERINNFAQEHDVLISGMKHTKKEQANTAQLPSIHKLYGTSAWSEVPQLIQVLYPINDKLREALDMGSDETELLMYNVKANYAPGNLPSKGFRIETEALELDGGKTLEATKMNFIGMRDINDDDLNEAKGQTKKEVIQQKRDNNELDETIKGILIKHDFEMPIMDLVNEVQESGLFSVSDRTIRRRTEKLGVTTELIKDGDKGAKNYVVPEELRERWNTNLGMDF